MASEVSRGVASAVQWVIVGVAIGVLPTYVLMSEHGKKESETASANAASAAAASVYAAWNAAPKVTCSAPTITMPTVEALTPQAGGGTPRVARAHSTPRAPGAKPDESGGDDNEAQMMMPMLNMMQGMMNENGGGSPAGSGMPDMTELMKNMPKK
jgi:hypothetical protein